MKQDTMISFDVVVETPKGSGQKYSYEPASHFYKLKKILPAGMIFPYDFGFIPGTEGKDGDPLDILMISELASFPGCKIRCRLIGGFKAEQSEKAKKKKLIRNDRFFAVPTCSQMYKEVTSVKDLSPEILKEIEDFFINYNAIEGKQFKILSNMEKKAAEKIIKKQYNLSW